MSNKGDWSGLFYGGHFDIPAKERPEVLSAKSIYESGNVLEGQYIVGNHMRLYNGDLVCYTLSSNSHAYRQVEAFRNVGVNPFCRFYVSQGKFQSRKSVVEDIEVKAGFLAEKYALDLDGLASFFFDNGKGKDNRFLPGVYVGCSDVTYKLFVKRKGPFYSWGARYEFDPCPEASALLDLEDWRTKAWATFKHSNALLIVDDEGEYGLGECYVAGNVLFKDPKK